MTMILFSIIGATYLVQPVDVSFNAPFKREVEKQAMDHLQANLESYMKGGINASERRVLFTKWVGSAWDTVSSNTDMIIRSFKKCGISTAIDGSEDNEINVTGLENYVVDSDMEEEATDEENTDKQNTDCDEEDPFADLD